MSKTIKVITLLNKIANGEEVPEKIKYDNDIFIYDKERKDYIHQLDSEGWVGETLLFKIKDINFVEDFINVKVEIIEEEPEIDIQGIEETNELLALKSVDMRVSTEENLRRIDKAEIDMFYKLIEVTRKQNKMLRAIKQLDKKIKEK